MYKLRIQYRNAGEEWQHTGLIKNDKAVNAMFKLLSKQYSEVVIYKDPYA